MIFRRSTNQNNDEKRIQAINESLKKEQKNEKKKNLK